VDKWAMKFMNAPAVCQSFTLTPSNAMDVGLRWIYSGHFYENCLVNDIHYFQKDI
jgi:hypothetical protein